MPIGLFLPLLNTKYKRVFIFTAVSVLLITAVELIQMLARVGSFDIDDIILNTFGVLLGLLMTKAAIRQAL
jgi:glycopeptide antibiotics resistance protein